jgi:hypothetical protein
LLKNEVIEFCSNSVAEQQREYIPFEGTIDEAYKAWMILRGIKAGRLNTV